MAYTYSFDRVSTLSPLDFITEQNDIWENDLETDNIETLLIPLDDFDELEIL
jgi:hypothetical protein